MYDVQIANCARHDAENGHSRDRYVHGLAKATAAFLRTDPARARKFHAIKSAGLKLFAPEHGGSYEVWRARPLPRALVEYAAADDGLLLEMKAAWECYTPVRQNVTPSTPTFLARERARLGGISETPDDV